MNIDVNTLQGITFDGHDVQGLVLNGVTLWTKGGSEPVEDNNYFTIEVVSGNNVSVFLKPNSSYTCTWYVWKNTIPNADRSNYTYGPFTPTSSTTTVDSSIVVSAGDKLRFYRVETTGLTNLSDTASGYTKFYTSDDSARFKIYGNAASLMGYADVCPAYAMHRLFRTTAITDASGLLLPWTSFNSTGAQFSQMFENASNLVSGPALLPAPLLYYRSYYRMFYNCGNLTQAPIILGTPNDGPNSNKAVLQYMFYQCLKLKYIKCLATTNVSGVGNTQAWTQSLPSGGTFVKHPNSNWGTGTSGIPSGWTVQTATE